MFPMPSSPQRWFILAVAAASLIMASSAVAGPAVLMMPPPPPLPDAKSYVLMDFQTGQIIAEKNPNLQLPPASLTKLMTAYLTYGALADGALHWHQQIHVSRVAWHTGGSGMFIQPNLPVTVDQLMHGLIIDSGNDAGVALTQAIAGSRATFVDEMNATAMKLELPGAHYSDVDGLTNPDSTSLSTRAGHTNAAGHCMDTTAIRNGRRLIAVVMGAPSWSSGVNDVVALVDYGYRFTMDHSVTRAGEMIGT